MMMEPDNMNSLDDADLNKNAFKNSKLEFHVPEGSMCQEIKTEDISLKKESGIRRFIRAVCFCPKEGKKEENNDIYVAYNPSFKPAS